MVQPRSFLTEQNGTSLFAYGGDFGDEPHDADFGMDGMIYSDHTPTPGLAEYKKAIEPVTVTRNGDELDIQNHYDFIDLSHLSCTWKVVGESGSGEPVALELPSIPADTAKSIPIPAYTTNKPREAWLEPNFALKNATAWAKQGHEVAWSQLQVKSDSPAQSPAPKAALLAQQKEGRLLIIGPERQTSYSVSLETGQIQWTAQGHSGWDSIAPAVLGWGINTFTTYTIYDDGIDVHATGPFSGCHPSTVPRIGLNLDLLSSFKHSSWFGRGRLISRCRLGI